MYGVIDSKLMLTGICRMPTEWKVKSVDIRHVFSNL